MDFDTYPSMDALPFQQQYQVFDDCVDESFDMEQLLAAAFDSSSYSSSPSSELFQCQSNSDDICFDPSYSVSDQLFRGEKNDVFVADDDDVLFPQNLFISPLDEIYQLGTEFNHSDNSFNKRQKMNPNEYDSNYFLRDLATPPELPQLIEPPPPPPPPFQFSIPPVFCHGISSNDNGQKKEDANRILSAQSLSARQRRRKISEKTKELGKLVPGGQRLNTAEMFEAASSYIKFLQAQFAVLQLMESSSSSPEHEEEDLQCLIESPLVQEKLYAKEKCIAPKGLVESLETNNDIQSHSQMLKDVRNLILTFG